ncbi:MAG: short-chain dehydrogenase [Opitutales bacterium TMED158]|nr:MAG: short-chain dehydrogenase [Opitutales bacterium TMED158]
MANSEFSGKAAIVTGAGIGIGFEIARSLAMGGAAVVLNDLDTDVADAAARAIADEGGECMACPGDASDPEFIESMVEECVSSYGSIDIAIANAGITTYGSFLDYTVEKFQKLVSLNLQGSFFLAQSSAVRMKQTGFGGRVLLMSSVTGHQSHPYLIPYGMTKAALRMLAKGLVGEVSQYGITVNAISPGAVLTERTTGDDPGFESSWGEATPIGRPASTQDIANAALFLVSDKARHITGQTLLVDGGWTCISPVPNLEIPD